MDYLADFGPNVEPEADWPECLPAFRKYQPVIDWGVAPRMLAVPLPEDRL